MKSNHITALAVASLLCAAGASAQSDTPSSATRDSRYNTPNTQNQDLTTSRVMSGNAVDTFATSIQSTSFEQRDQLSTDVKNRIEATEKDLSQVKKNLSSDAKKTFKEASKEVGDREKELKKSLGAAKKTSADNWESARSDVAAKYQAYMEAVARAQATAGTAPASSYNR